MAGAMGRMISSTKAAVRSAIERATGASIDTDQRRLPLGHAAADCRGAVAAASPAQRLPLGVPVLLVHGGPRPGGLAPRESRTRFSWSIEG
jgi:hypothetical protein